MEQIKEQDEEYFTNSNNNGSKQNFRQSINYNNNFNRSQNLNNTNNQINIMNQQGQSQQLNHTNQSYQQHNTYNNNMSYSQQNLNTNNSANQYTTPMRNNQHQNHPDTSPTMYRNQRQKQDLYKQDSYRSQSPTKSPNRSLKSKKLNFGRHGEKNILTQEKIEFLSKTYGFNVNEIKAIKKSFDQISDKTGSLSIIQFKDSLGLVGLNEYMVDSIWKQIVGNQNDKADFEDFLGYLQILMNGNNMQKAEWSFNMISSDKISITEQDIMNVVYNMSDLWNKMIGSVVYPSQEYIHQIFSLLDIDRDGSISFQDFYIVYNHQQEIFGWYEYLNLEDKKIQYQKDQYNELIEKRMKTRSAKKYSKDLPEDQLLDDPLMYQQKQKLKKERQLQQRVNNLKLRSEIESIKSKVQDCLQLVSQEQKRHEANFNKHQQEVSLQKPKIYTIKSPEKKHRKKDHKRTISRTGLSAHKVADEPGEITCPEFEEVHNLSIFQSQQTQISEAKENSEFKQSILNGLKNVIELTYNAKSTCSDIQKDIQKQVTSQKNEITELKQKKQIGKAILTEKQIEAIEKKLYKSRKDISPHSFQKSKTQQDYSPIYSQRTPKQFMNLSQDMFFQNNANFAQSQYYQFPQDVSPTNISITQFSPLNNNITSNNINNNSQQLQNSNNQIDDQSVPKYLIKCNNNSYNDVIPSTHTMDSDSVSPSPHSNTNNNVQNTNDLDQSQQKNKKKDKKNSKDEIEDQQKQTQQNLNIFQNPEGTRSNFCVYFGQENFEIVLYMMIGIRTSVKHEFSLQDKDNLSSEKFKQIYRFDLWSSLKLPQHKRNKLQQCKFFDYAPAVFERIRNHFGISDEMYLKSIGPEQMLSNLIMGNLSSLAEKCSTGKSDSFFYYSQDDQFMLKTIKFEEFKYFQSALRNYYQHIDKYRDTLISKIFGLHMMKIGKKGKKQKQIYFVIMGNLFQSGHYIDVRYDIKGSTFQRTSKINGEYPKDDTIARKDLDWEQDNVFLNIPDDIRRKFKEQVDKDVKFFIQNQVNDYSLLVGYHEIRENYSPLKNQQFNQEDLQLEDSNNNKRKCDRFYELYEGGILSKDKQHIIFLGIIDIFTFFGFSKKMEYLFKTGLHGDQVSCLPPSKYGDRFQKYMYNVAIVPPQKREQYQ